MGVRVKIAKTASASQIVEEVGEAVAEAREAMALAMTVGIMQHQDDGVEWAYRDKGDITVTIATAPTTFGAVQAVDQIQELDPAVIAAADSDPEPILVIVDDPRRVRHEPELKHVLEQNAAALIEDLGIGVWVFRVDEHPAGLRLRLLNQRLLGDKPARLNAVDPQAITLDADTRWEAGEPPPMTAHYLRPVAAPHLVQEGCGQ